MHCLLRYSFLCFLFWAAKSFGFIPPLVSLIKEGFDGRKSFPITEIVLKHRVEIRTGEFVDIDERIVAQRNQTLMIWSSPSSSPISGSFSSLSYSIGNDRNLQTRSGLFLRYFLAPSAEAFQENLISEQFLRRDQLLQYKPGATFTGDPLSWNLHDDYLVHDDIFLHRLESGISIATIGSDDGNSRKTFFLDEAKHALARLEWRDKNQVIGWNFDSFSKITGDGVFAHRFALDSAGADLIGSSLVSRRALKDKQMADFRTAWRQARSAPLSRTWRPHLECF